jgi:beta-xylosidase
MDQGSTPINGPHQGAWVDTPSKEDWFLHFQDKGAYGRVVHLQPMKWVNDWPVMGIDKDGDGKGEPVLTYKKPALTKTNHVMTPAESDEFDGTSLGLQWQWQANPEGTWSFLNSGNQSLRLYSVQRPVDAKNLWDVPNVLMQKFPAPEFKATVKVSFNPNARLEYEKVGFVVMGQRYAYLGLKSTNEGIDLVYSICENAPGGIAEQESVIAKGVGRVVYFRVVVREGAKCTFSYSHDGKKFTEVGTEFQAEAGRWIGAKVGLFCTRESQSNDSGYADLDWFRIETIK